MKKFASLFVVTLLLTSSVAWAAAQNQTDLRYCLDQPSNLEIAKCAGELTPGKGAVPLPKQEASNNEAVKKEAPAKEPAKKEAESVSAH